MKRLFYQTLILALRRLGLSGIRLVAGLVGFVMWTFLRRRRMEAVKRVKERLSLPENKAQAVAKASFYNIAMSFMEIFYNDRFGPERVRVEREEDWRLFHAMVNNERPMVFISGHFGAWELLGSLVGRATGQPMVTVARKQKDPVMSDIIQELRAQGNLLSIDHRESAGALLACLRKGGITCFLVDHNTRSREAVFLPFLGETAAVNMGPAMLALRAKALIFPIFLRREENGRYLLRMEEPLDTATLEGPLADRVREAAFFYTKAMEKQVLDAPEQWFWMHRRWKTRPSDSDSSVKLQK